MKKLPKSLFAIMFMLVFAVVVLPAIKDDFAAGKSYAIENSDLYASDATASEIGGTFVFHVYGYGHGVGMSQHGAMQMAKNGDTYEKILAHYYPSTTLIADSSTPLTINYAGEDIPIVEYICKTTKKEMGYSSAGKEALKAQMAAIYTFAKYYNFDVLKSKHAYADNFEFEGTPIHKACLEYLGMADDTDTPVAKYVDYNGEAANTVYFSSSAGKTASAAEVWGAGSYPYLNGGVSSCEAVDAATVEISAADMKKYIMSYANDNDIAITLSDNPAEWLEILSHDSAYNADTGYVTEIRVGNVKVRGNAFRCNVLDFKIRSHCFAFEYIPEEETTTKPSATVFYPTTVSGTTAYPDYPATTSKYPVTTTKVPSTENDWFGTTVAATTTYPATTKHPGFTETTTKVHEETTVATTLPPMAENISRFYIHDITLIENYNGHWEIAHPEGCTPNGCDHNYFRYNEYPHQKITVYYNDGTEFTGDVYEFEERTGLNVVYRMDQSYSNQWSAGNTYEVEYHINYPGNAEGVSSTYKVTIIETPVESVELSFGCTQFVENVSGHPVYTVNEYGEIVYSYFHYDTHFNSVKIKFKEDYKFMEDIGYSYDIFDGQSAYNPWGVGKHTVTLSVLGYTESFEIEVVPTKEIRNISVEAARKVVEYVDGYTEHDIIDETTGEYINGDYFNYYVDSPTITVEFADGTVVKGDEWEIVSHLIPEARYSYYPFRVETLQSYKNQWTVGKNTAYIIILGRIIPFEVEVVPCPFSKIEFVKAPDKTEYIVGEFASTEGAVIRISYKDGDYLDVPLIYNGYYFDTHYYDSKLEQTHELFFSSPWMEKAGNDKITVSLSDRFTCEYPVTVKENLIESISIHNSENNDLIITAHNSDGTTEEMKVLNLWGDDGGSDGETETHTGGWLFTDKGIFMGYFYSYYSGHYAVQLQFYDGREHRDIDSNKLADCPWLDLWHKLHRYSHDPISFNGEMTEENVDLLVFLSLVSDDFYCRRAFSFDEYGGLKPVYDADFITQQIKKHLVVNNIDLTLSKRYNPSDNTIAINTDLLSEGLRVPRIAPFVFKDGYWYVEASSESYLDANEFCKSYYWIYDDELRIVAFGKDKISAPEKPSVSIMQPTETVISYGDSIILHADATKIPAGGYVEWTASNSNFEMEISADGTTCKITPKTSGDTTFTATVYDAKGKVISSDEQTMTSKANFFDRLIAFFKKLFSLTKVIPQVFKGI